MPLKALQAGIRYVGSIFDEQPKLDAGERPLPHFERSLGLSGGVHVFTEKISAGLPFPEEYHRIRRPNYAMRRELGILDTRWN